MARKRLKKIVLVKLVINPLDEVATMKTPPNKTGNDVEKLGDVQQLLQDEVQVRKKRKGGKDGGGTVRPHSSLTITLMVVVMVIVVMASALLLVLWVSHWRCPNALPLAPGLDYFITEKIELTMPKVTPNESNQYLCTAMKLDPNKTLYIEGFVPFSKKAQQMTITGCNSPGRNEPIWDCGSHHSRYPSGVVCSGRSQVLYAWSKNAPKFHLPPGVTFKVGKGTCVKYLIIQAYYEDATDFQDGLVDSSGIIVEYTEQPSPRQAGVLKLGTFGYIPPGKTVHMESACSVDEDVILSPIGLLPQTRALGTIASAYVVNTGNNNYTWHVLKKQSPQLPQQFFPIEDPTLLIKKGDVVATRCTMVNPTNEPIHVGLNAGREMCNIYLLYWTLPSQMLHMKYCATCGYPKWFWKDYPLGNIPDHDASTL